MTTPDATSDGKFYILITLKFLWIGTDHNPDSKVHAANMGPIWDRQDPGGPHVGPMNFAIWVSLQVD